MVQIPLTSLSMPHFCVCPKSGPGFPTSYVMVFVCAQLAKMRDSCSFIDIGGIDDHHCLNFLFTIIFTKTFI